jgi:hypothetical protein
VLVYEQRDVMRELVGFGSVDRRAPGGVRPREVAVFRREELDAIWFAMAADAVEQHPLDE